MSSILLSNLIQMFSGTAIPSETPASPSQPNISKKAKQRQKLKAKVDQHLRLANDYQTVDQQKAWGLWLDNTTDYQVLRSLRFVPPEHRPEIAFKALLRGRLALMKKWWQLGRSYQFRTIDEWEQVLLVLVLFTRKYPVVNDYYIPKNTQPAQRTLAVFRTLLQSSSLQAFCRQEIKNRYTQPQLVNFLVYQASCFPYGISILSREWKKFPIDIWNLQDSYFYDVCSIYIYKKARSETYRPNCYNSLLFTLRHGHPTDLKFFWRRPKIWLPVTGYFPKSLNHTGTILVPIAMASLNPNIKMLRYFLDYYESLRSGLLAQFESVNIAKIIYSYNDFQPYFQIDHILEAINVIQSFSLLDIDVHNYYTKTKEHQKGASRLKLLMNTFTNCPLQSTNQQSFRKNVSKILDTNKIINHLTQFSKNIYHTGVARQLPEHARPEQLLSLSRQSDCLYTPKADGVFYHGRLTGRNKGSTITSTTPCYPAPPLCPVSAEKLENYRLPLSGRSVTLYLVFDLYADNLGDWQARMQVASEHVHSIQRTFQNLGEELEAFQNFLKEIDQRPVKKNKQAIQNIWWPKGVYRKNQSEFPDLLRLMDRPPVTPYPNDGWIVTSPDGDLLKVKPYQHLTLDLAYPLSPDFLELPSEIQETFLPSFLKKEGQVWQYEWHTHTQTWLARKPRPDRVRGNTAQICQTLTEQQLYPWYPSDLIPFLQAPQLYYSSHDRLVRKQPELKRLISLINRQKTIMGKSTKPWVEIGCGYQPHYGSVIRIDLDPNVITHHLRRSKDPKSQQQKPNFYGYPPTNTQEIRYYWLDGATFRHPLTQRLVAPNEQLNWPKQLMIHFGLHYLVNSAERAEQFSQHLNYFEEFQITIINGDLIPEQTLEDEMDAEESKKTKEFRYIFPDGSYIRKLPDEPVWHPDLCWGERYLKWQQRKPAREILLTMKFLKDYLPFTLQSQNHEKSIPVSYLHYLKV